MEVKGINAYVDGNSFNGKMEDLLKLYGLELIQLEKQHFRLSLLVHSHYERQRSLPG